ncbi:hypothetical protein HU200_039683 [Digitaria exilis]|uniref:C2H2-type domain-containing protein n=1 Tax=Digitaria exilis TaxID=1010633 RepID=A0A835B9W7_9POAL|nr:hypothetical protein HU200_039683 [Digitaria exilis]CAB3469132.1 unnamed protein product [Digitaria exilis]
MGEEEEEDGRELPLKMVVSGGRLTSKRRHQCSSSSSHSGSGTNTTSMSQQQEKEEEDMVARCLILLAQHQQGPAVSSSKCTAAYECKTCNRCFPSFQALGGHRTSHSNNGNKRPRRPEITTRLSPRTSAHECSACGAAFSSGQALGGHMRRHRPLPTADSTGSGLQGLDLNLLPGPSMEQEVTSPAKRVHHFN